MMARQWLDRRIRRLPAPFRQEWRALLLFGLIFVIAAWLCFEVIEEVFLESAVFAPDQAVYAALQNLRTPWLDQVMIAITELGDTPVVIVVAAVVALWLVHERAGTP
jgi:undecaprenyl-diphosphatase